MANKIIFNKANIEALPIPKSGNRDTYHDAKTSGLQIRVTPTGTKTFSVFRRVKNGKPERVTLGRYPNMTVEKAKKMAAEINLQMITGKNPAEIIRESKKEMTLDDLFFEYMERRAAFNKRPDKPRDTFRLYLSDWGKRKLSSIKHEEVDRLHKKIGRNNGQVTANIVLKLLHVMFNKAINEWRIWNGENPAHGIAKFPEQSRDRFLQSDELPRFFKSLAEEENETIRDYVLMSLLTGARRSNVLSMKWADINFNRQEWRTQETKNGTPQTITLSLEAIEVLQNRKPEYGDIFVFPGSGKSGHLEEPKKGWQRILERAGIEDLRIHDLRRTLGSWQAKTGASLAIIGKSLNHKNQNTTAIYARLDLDPIRDSVNTAISAMLTAAGLKKWRGCGEFPSEEKIGGNMGFFGISEEFYFLTESPPSYPFPQLPDIVSRTKYLLKNRSKREIISAANTIDWFIEEYFNQCKYECVQDILTNIESCNNWVLRYLPYEERNEIGISKLLDEWPSETGNPCPYISSPENTSELIALKESIGQFSLDDDEDFPDGREFEYFAVLALKLAGNSIMALPSKRQDNFSNLSTAQQNMAEFKKSLDRFTESISPGISLAMAGKYALDAMDAACYAEQLQATEEQNKKLEKLQIELHKASQDTDTIIEEKLKKKTSLAAKHAAIKRHAKSTELRNMAIRLYLDKTWPSVRQASKIIFPQLVEHGNKINFVFSPDRGEQTVYEWLLSASKAIRKQADV